MSSVRTGFHSAARNLSPRLWKPQCWRSVSNRHRSNRSLKLTGPGFGTLRSFTRGLLLPSATASRNLKQSCEDLTSVAEQLPYTSLKSDAESRGAAETCTRRVQYSLRAWIKKKRRKGPSSWRATKSTGSVSRLRLPKTTSGAESFSFRKVLAEQLPKSQLDELGLEQNLLKSEDLSCASACLSTTGPFSSMTAMPGLGTAWAKRPFSRLRLGGSVPCGVVVRACLWKATL